MPDEDAVRAQLDEAARRAYGPERANELGKRLGEIAHWVELIDRQPLDLLDEEPDSDGR